MPTYCCENSFSKAVPGTVRKMGSLWAITREATNTPLASVTTSKLMGLPT